MKILWLSHFLLYPDTGYGALQRSRNLLKELSKYHELYLICLYRESDRELVPDPQTARKDLESYCSYVSIVEHSVSRLDWIRFLLKSTLTGVPLSTYIYHSPKLLDEVIRICSLHGVDLIHSDTLGLVEPCLPMLQKITVLNHHDIESHKMSRRCENEKNLLKKLFFKYERKCLLGYEKKYTKKFDMNIVVSEMDKTRLSKIDSDIPVEVIENGVDCEYFSFSPREPESRKIVFTGALDYYPNLKGMLYFCKDIWPLLKEKIPGITFSIIGKNPPKSLESLISGLRDITLEGFVDDVRPHLRDAQVFVCPIKEGGGTRIKILDAFSQGIPVVSTSVGAEGLDLIHGTHLFIADSPQDFVDTIESLMNNAELSLKMSYEARKFVEEHYSYRIIGEKMANTYESLSVKNPVNHLSIS